MVLSLVSGLVLLTYQAAGMEADEGENVRCAGKFVTDLAMKQS
jgi:hypothetical protein